MSDLRDHLFDTLKALTDKEKPMELDRAKAVGEIAQTIINSAKVEVDYLKTVGPGPSSEFFPAPASALPALTNGNGKQPALPKDAKCRDCADERKDVAAVRALPGGTALCDIHWRKRAGMAAATTNTPTQ
jgi:hypothetical protein